MLQKYETYKRYDWAGDAAWQQYLTGLYPVPPLKTLEKFRRKWYKKNKVPDFDIDYTPPAPETQQNTNQRAQQPGMSEQQRFQQRYAQQYQKENPTGAYSAFQNNSVDRVPWLKTPHLLCLIAFVFAYPLGIMTTQLIFVANLIGIVRKGGYPKFSQEFMKSLVFTEEFNNLTYLLSILMAKKSFLLYTPILISVGLLLCWEGKRVLDANPQAIVLSNATVKKYLLKGASNEMQEKGRMIRGNVEVFVGFYMVGGIIIGQSSIVSAIMYWQMMRMRYMINPIVQASFSKLHNDLIGYLGHGMVPAIVLSTYMKFAGYLSSYGDPRAQAEAVNASGGGMMGALKNSCNIF